MNIKSIIQEKFEMIKYIILKMFDMGLGFLITLLIVKKLTGYEYGVYTLIITVLGLLISFGFSWTSSSLMYFGVEEKLKYGSLNRTFWARNIILLSTYILILSIFILFYKKLDIYLTVKVSSYIFVWMTLKILTDYISVYYLATEKRFVSVCTTITIKIFLIFFLFMITSTLQDVLIFSIISECTGLVWIVKIDRKDFGKFIFNRDIFKEVLTFGLWQLFGFTGLYLINFGDNLVIKKFLTITDVGVYNVAYQLYTGMASFAFLFSNYFAPQVVKAINKKDIKKINSIYKRDRYLLVLLLTIPHIVVIIFARNLILTFYGLNYEEATTSLIVLTIVSLCEYFTVFNMLTYNCFRKYHILQIMNIIQAVLNVLLDIILVPYFGITGAAYGTLLSFLIIATLKTYFAEQLLKNFKNIYLNKDTND